MSAFQKIGDTNVDELQKDILLCPLCSTPLEEQSDGTLWCPMNMQAFEPAEAIENQKWRGFSPTKKVTLYQELGELELRGKYFLHPAQVQEVADLAREAENVSDPVLESVAPLKRALLSLALSIPDGAALCEFIDNARDAGVRRRPGECVSVCVTFNPILRSLEIVDDAGGMDLPDLVRCLTLGSKPLESDDSIGRYGIGAKEAIYHFGREVTIRTRTAAADTGMRTVVGADWLDSPDWNVTVERLKSISSGTTSIRVGQMRRLYSDDDIARLRRHLWGTYERCIQEGTLALSLNGELIENESEYSALYPPEFYPRQYEMKCGRLSVELKVLLIKDTPEMSGLWMYAQGRRFVHLRWSDPRVNLVLGKKLRQHSLTSHIRVELAFRGPISDIPISSNKHDIQNNNVLQMLVPKLQSLTEPYFKAVNPLSQGGMGLIEDFTSDKPYERADTGTPVFDLGRVEGPVSIPATIKADVNSFSDWVKERTRPISVRPPEPRTAPPEKPAVAPKQASGENSKSVAQANVSVTPSGGKNNYVLALANERAIVSADRKTEIERWLEEGRRLGINISVEWMEVEPV